MHGVTVQHLYDSLKVKLRLKLINENLPLDRIVRTAEIHRPGLAFSGYYGYFAHQCVQILGRTELHYLATVAKRRRDQNLQRFFSYRIPCIVVSRGQKIPKDFLNHATQAKVPIFVSPLMTATIASQITIFIEEQSAPEMSLHGTLLDVFGIGTLLLGKSGVGKSECALELVERGHQLIADDLVEIKLLAGKLLMGYSNDLIRHHMEIRGLGIINMRSMFGAGAVRNQKRISMVVTLEKWSRKAEYERLGLEEKTHPLLGIRLPHLVIPVRPGRNISILIEVAALGRRAKQMGEHPAQEFNRRLIASIAQSQESGLEDTE